MKTKGVTGKRTASAAGRVLRSSIEGRIAKKAAGSDLAQAKKGSRHGSAVSGRDFDARLDAAHARIDGVLRRLG